MNNAVKIKELCESWWGELANSTRKEQQQYAENLLQLLGWIQPIPFTPKEGAQTMSALTYLLRANSQTTVATYFLLPGALEPPASIIDLGLDFCATTRLLVDESRALNVHYVFITDLHRSYLYDIQTDELLLHAGDTGQFNDLFTLVLRKDMMERGSLDEVRRQPRSVVALGIREWAEHWMGHISRGKDISEEQASIIVDRMWIIRYLMDHKIFRRRKWRLDQRFMSLVDRAYSAEAAGVGTALVKLFHDMWFDYRIDLFEVDPVLDRVLQDDEIAIPLLKEVPLLSSSKFSVATILESFNYGEPADKLRVRMVPDFNEEREFYLAKQSLASIDQARIEIDLLEEGYRAIFIWFDRVVQLYERLETDFNTKTQVETPMEEDIDLFAWSEIDSTKPQACADKFAHACERGFGIYYSSPMQYRVARLLLTMHLISRYKQSNHPVSHLPSMQHVMKERPKLLSAGQVMNPRPKEILPSQQSRMERHG